MQPTEFDRPAYSLSDTAEVETPVWLILPVLTTAVTLVYWWFFDVTGPTKAKHKREPDSVTPDLSLPDDATT